MKRGWGSLFPAFVGVFALLVFGPSPTEPSPTHGEAVVDRFHSVKFSPSDSGHPQGVCCQGAVCLDTYGRPSGLPECKDEGAIVEGQRDATRMRGLSESDLWGAIRGSTNGRGGLHALSDDQDRFLMEHPGDDATRLLYRDDSPLYKHLKTQMDDDGNFPSVARRARLPSKVEVALENGMRIPQPNSHSLQQTIQAVEASMAQQWVSDGIVKRDWFQLANLWRAGGDTERVIQCSRQALHHSNGDVLQSSAAFFTLSQVFYTIGYLEEAQEALERALKLRNHTVFEYALARVEAGRGMFEDAIVRCSGVLQKRPYHPCQSLVERLTLLPEDVDEETGSIDDSSVALYWHQGGLLTLAVTDEALKGKGGEGKGGKGARPPLPFGSSTFPAHLYPPDEGEPLDAPFNLQPQPETRPGQQVAVGSGRQQGDGAGEQPVWLYSQGGASQGGQKSIGGWRDLACILQDWAVASFLALVIISFIIYPLRHAREWWSATSVPASIAIIHK